MLYWGTNFLERTKVGFWPVNISNAVKIGNNCYIGSNSVIDSDITIEDNCIIGANAFINKSVLKEQKVFGTPGKVIGKKL